MDSKRDEAARLGDHEPSSPTSSFSPEEDEHLLEHDAYHGGMMTSRHRRGLRCCDARTLLVIVLTIFPASILVALDVHKIFQSYARQPTTTTTTTTTTPSCLDTTDHSGYLCAPNGAPPSLAREQRGCEFDQLSFHWYPADKFWDPDNQKLLDDFMKAGPGGTWHRFYDNRGLHEIDPKVGEALTEGWVTRREHLNHCVFSLQQTHLWYTKGYDPPFNYSHTEHCTRYLLQAVLENPPADIDDLVVHGIAWPEHPQIIKPFYPCKEEGLSCKSW